MPCLDITAGLGGGTSAIARHHKIRVEGIEIDPELAGVAQELMHAHGIAETTPIRCADPLSEKPEGGKYGAIFARETLFTLPDRKTLLQNIATSLSPLGSILLTDFMLSDRKSDTLDLSAWQQAEPTGALPLTLEEYSELLEQAHFTIHASNDMSAAYIGYIQAGWKTTPYMSSNGQTFA